MPAEVVSDLTRFEFDTPCEFCDGVAEWAAWALHNAYHEEASGYACTRCKEIIELSWLELLQPESRCNCGHVNRGLLSDNFRAIRL